MALSVLAFAGGCGVVTADAPAFSGGSAGEADGGFGGDAFAGDDAGSSCRPSDALVFTAGNYRGAVTPTNACPGGDDGGGDGGEGWEAFYDVCLGPNKNTGACAAYKAEFPTCAACILTPYAANQLGPILDYGQYVGGNVAGCIELTVPSDPSCPKAVQALSECELAGCQANCPVNDPISLTARDECAAAADTTVCNSLYQMTQACRANEADAGEGTACSTTAFKDFYDDVVPLFCGPQAADGGAGRGLDGGAADAGRDASGDAAAPAAVTDGGAPVDARAD